MEANNQHITNLLEHCKKQDHVAQLEIYKLYFKAMYNSAFRILKDEFEAEDIMQESFLTAFTKLNSFKGEVAFGAWLKKIVINKSLTQLKKINKYKEVKLEVVHNQEVEDDLINYSSLDKTAVVKEINNLKENYRLVLTLHLIEGFDYEEIAQILKYTNENVRTTISRAKKKLKQVLLANTCKNSIYGR